MKFVKFQDPKMDVFENEVSDKLDDKLRIRDEIIANLKKQVCSYGDTLDELNVKIVVRRTMIYKVKQDKSQNVSGMDNHSTKKVDVQYFSA